MRWRAEMICLDLHAVETEQTHREPKPERIIIPTDLMVAAWRQLFPAERMVVFGGRPSARGIHISSLIDVTEHQPSPVHVRACPQRLGTALLDLERTGAHLAVWMHSHPGHGPGATCPSRIDLAQERDLREDYSDRLVCIIAVGDGWLRLWGRAIASKRVTVEWIGRGIQAHPEESHVYRLTMA